MRTLNLRISTICYKEVFPDDLKIAKVTHIYKSSNSSDIVTVPPCFSRILVRLMYNHLYEHLKVNNIHYEKQFGFLSIYSTSEAIIQLDDIIFYSFEMEQFTLVVFIELSKDIATVGYLI